MVDIQFNCTYQQTIHQAVCMHLLENDSSLLGGDQNLEDHNEEWQVFPRAESIQFTSRTSEPLEKNLKHSVFDILSV